METEFIKADLGGMILLIIAAVCILAIFLGFGKRK